MNVGEAELALLGQLRMCGYDVVPQFQFAAPRKWKADLYLPPDLLIEVEGGVWTEGRHTQPSGFIRDIEKYNTATLRGFRLLRFTPKMVNDGIALATIETALRGAA